MLWLRRAARELLAGCQQTAAATGRPLPAAATAAMAQLQSRLYSKGATPEDESMAEPMVQPFSVAMKQLEEAVSETVLPADALAQNRQALATLKEFASSLEAPTGYPPAAVKNVQFVFRDPYSGGRLQRVRCQLKTTGGNCSQLVQQSLGQLLQRLGLNPYFYFDGEQFRPRAPPRPRTLPKPRAAAPAAPPSPEEVAAVRAKAAAAGFPSQPISEAQFKEMEQQSDASREAKAKAAEVVNEVADQIKKLDPLLAAVAAVPWLSHLQDKESQDKAQLLRSKGMDEIEAWGWNVRGAVRRIWQGERDPAKLMVGKDAGDLMAIKTILFHAISNDKKYGKKTVQE